jgi:hypothetical protein
MGQYQESNQGHTSILWGVGAIADVWFTLVYARSDFQAYCCLGIVFHRPLLNLRSVVG